MQMEGVVAHTAPTHLEAGRIWPSSALAGSGTFIIPKADPVTLPCWVNDYCQLNSNTVTDSFLIPCISEILADIAQGKIFASLDMTNSFFQTRMHPDNVNLTAVNTPWGLYEWVVMPIVMIDLLLLVVGHWDSQG